MLPPLEVIPAESRFGERAPEPSQVSLASITLRRINAASEFSFFLNRSVSLQMVTNKGDTEGLFHAAFMQSGSPLSTRGAAMSGGQAEYDAIAKQVGCFGEVDSLACLRTIPYQQLRAAMDQTPAIFSYSSLVSCDSCSIV